MADAISVQSAVNSVQRAGQDDAVQTLMLRKALDLQTQTAAQLVNALPQQPALATSGAVGTQVNTYA